MRRLLPGLLVGVVMVGTAIGSWITPVYTATAQDEQVRVAPGQVRVNDSFINPLVELFGDVRVGKEVFVAGNTVVRADPETRICLGAETNIQDNVTFIAVRNFPAPESECGLLASSARGEVSIAHQATIKNSLIGRFTFVGFRARLENVVLEEGAFVLHGATLANVTIGKDRLVPVGAVIRSQDEADALPLKEEAQAEFQREVLEVNREFAEGYAELYQESGYDAVVGIGPAPQTSWNPDPIMPTIGQNVRVDELARIVGDVRLGENSSVGRRTSIRADEGAPISIGFDSTIEDRVTFHALKGTSISIGNGLHAEDNIVFHGPLQAGDNLIVYDNAVVFRSVIGTNVTIGAGALVIGVTLRDGVTVPDDAVITTQEQADAL